MIDLKIENDRVEQLQLQRMGEAWIHALTERAFNRLEQFCQPDTTSLLLTPRRFMTLENIVDLMAKYREWFGDCTNFQVEGSRVGQVGERLGIFYRFLLKKEGGWHTIEQQMYCTLKDGRVQRLHLLCSGFQAVRTNDQMVPIDSHESVDQEPVRDELLEFQTEAPETSSTCAVLTPVINSKLREMQTGQVLEIRVDDPTAKGDIEAWSRLSGNTLLKVIDDEGQVMRFFVKKK